MAHLPEGLSVLRRRDFRLLFAGQAVSVLGDRMVTVALAFAVLQGGGSVADVGLVLAAAMIPSVGTALVGGVVADRVSRRAVMIGADLVRVVTQGTMATLAIAGVAGVWTLALLAGMTGAATGFFGPASIGLLPQVVPPEQLQPANALRSSGRSAGEIVGPLLAGLLVASAGAGWAIAADAATFAVSAVCLSTMRLPGRAGRVASQSRSFVSDLRQGWVAFSSRTWVWAFVAYFAIGNMLWGAWTALGPVVADRNLGGAAAWGTILAAMGVGALLGSVLATQTNPQRPLLFVAFTEGLFALPLAFLAATSSLALLAFGAFLSGSGMMLGMSVWESTLQRHIPGDSLSRVSSYDWFGSFAFFPLGLAIWGSVATAIGISTSLWLAFGLFVASILVLIAVPSIRRLPASPASESGRRTIAKFSSQPGPGA